MTLYVGSNKIKDVSTHGVYVGSTPIKQIFTFWEPTKNFIKLYQYNSYEPQQVLANISGNSSVNITFKKGVYYIRAQGAGGGGGNNNYWNNGGGGGSGAGFEGYIYVSKEFSSNVTTGVGGANSSAGTDTAISGVMTLGGGKGGDGGVAGAGGTLTISEAVTIIKSIIRSNGKSGNFSNGGSGDYRCAGGNSVLTNSGQGYGTGDLHNATAPGAGAGGQVQFDTAGGVGGDGECLIQYISYEPEGGSN